MGSFDVAQMLSLPELSGYLKRVNLELSEELTADLGVMNDPLTRLIESPGKRLRSTLTLVSVFSAGKHVNDKTIKACAAIELLHLASLVHDDIIDNASSRRGVQTVNGKEGLVNAILVGDYLLARALLKSTEVSSDVCSILSETFAKMCKGQSLESSDLFNIDRSEESLYNSIEYKTGALISASCKIGGILGGLEAGECRELEKFGQSFGMAFQIIDDVLDFTGNSKKLGKPVGGDMREGVYTLPLILGLKTTLRKELISLINDGSFSKVTDMLIETGSIEKTLQLAHGFAHNACESMTSFTDNKVANSLAKLPSEYLVWAMKDQVDDKYLAKLSPLIS